MSDHVAHRPTGDKTLLGFFLGALLAIVIGVYPASAWVLTPGLIVALTWILGRRPIRYASLAAFGGVLLGGGVLFAYGVVNTVVACIGTVDFCGRADVLPLTLLAVGLLVSGALLTTSAARRARI